MQRHIVGQLIVMGTAAHRGPALPVSQGKFECPGHRRLIRVGARYLPSGVAPNAEAAMDLLGVEELQICPWALREGVILRRLDSMRNGGG